MADLELVSMLEALAPSFLDSRKVSASWASATTGLVGGLTLPSDMVAVVLGCCDGERADFTAGKASAGLFFPKRTDQDLGQSRVLVCRWAGRYDDGRREGWGGRGEVLAGLETVKTERTEEKRGEGRKKRGRQRQRQKRRASRERGKARTGATGTGVSFTSSRRLSQTPSPSLIALVRSGQREILISSVTLPCCPGLELTELPS